MTSLETGRPRAAPSDRGEVRGWTLGWCAVVVIGCVALALRLRHLSGAPFEFHAVRQLYDVLMARGLWLDIGGRPPEGTAAAVAAATSPVIEPPVVQLGAAAVYRVIGHESVAVVRGVLALVWVAGTLPLVRALRATTRGTVPVLVGAAVWLLAPFGVVASRSFQPDGPLVVALAWLVSALLREDERPRSRRREAGVVAAAGIAVFLKLTAVFFVVPLLVALQWREHGPRSLLRPRTVVHLGLALVPGAAFYLWGVLSGTLDGQTGGRVLPHLLVDPWFWRQWALMTLQAVGPVGVVAVVAGTVLARGALRAVLVALCSGYAAFGVVFTYHYATHTYYHLPLVLVLALAVASIADAVRRVLLARDAAAPRVLAGTLLLVATGAGLLLTPYRAVAPDRPPGDWSRGVTQAREAGRLLDHSDHVLFLSQDAGLVMQTYGYLAGAEWPSSGDLWKESVDGSPARSVPERMADLRTRVDATWFLVSDFAELRQQPELATYLQQLPVGATGDGWVAYRLD